MGLRTPKSGFFFHEWRYFPVNSILATAWTSQVLSTLKATNSSANPCLLQAALNWVTKVVGAESYSMQTDKPFTNSCVLISARLYIHMHRHICTYMHTNTHSYETTGMFSLSESGWSTKTTVQILTAVSRYLQWSLLFRLYPLRSLLISLECCRNWPPLQRKGQTGEDFYQQQQSYNTRETGGKQEHR